MHRKRSIIREEQKAFQILTIRRVRHRRPESFLSTVYSSMFSASSLKFSTATARLNISRCFAVVNQVRKFLTIVFICGLLFLNACGFLDLRQLRMMGAKSRIMSVPHSECFHVELCRATSRRAGVRCQRGSRSCSLSCTALQRTRGNPHFSFPRHKTEDAVYRPIRQDRYFPLHGF